MRWIIILALFLSAWNKTNAQDTAIVDQIIGQVGSEIILLSDVEGELKRLQAYQQELPPDIRCVILENILIQRLMVNQAKLDSVEVSDDEVAQQIDARIANIMSYLRGDRDAFIQQYGKTPEEVHDDMEDDMRNMLLEEKMRGEILNSINITPSEVKAYFESIPKDSLPFYSSEVEVSEVVIAPKANSVSKAKAFQELDSIRTLIEGGADFGTMAIKYSDDPGSGPQGGDLGWSTRGKFVPEFEAAAFNLNLNEISPVIETQFGYHIIQLLDRKGSRLLLRHILIIPEVEQSDVDATIAKLDSIKTLIDADSMTFQEAVQKFSDKDEQSFNNGGRIINQVNGTTFFEVKDLDPDVYFAIADMEVGDISAPIEYLTARQETKYRIVRLNSKTPPHRANLQQDYAKIQELAKNFKKNDYLSNWLDTKISETFVEIDPMFQSCPGIAKWLKHADR
ncbi:MAG TPA: peptidylprolyl isomerase [Saprospiraceae bacterium]|nr:peptidylprolyl isomerase [Saprospiraceae bacterium]MCB9271962.1 peptidylprolyl isomerase [Lewinellaceae bacterium]HPG07629.1 peptidylprolyl isomerase [Saprospiraceae bacterium]HPR01358.1 peptidylprolyl isomerase [Saprospiraceae bacterium]HRV84897.1 peptidylprolyl isomerase [Saprospiraceae bacterium]